MFWQQSNTVAFHDRGRLSASFVICKALFGRQARHADVHARFLSITVRVFSTDLPDFADGGIEQHDINAVVVFRLPLGTKLFERAAFHQFTSMRSSKTRCVTVSMTNVVTKPKRAKGGCD